MLSPPHDGLIQQANSKLVRECDWKTVRERRANMRTDLTALVVHGEVERRVREPHQLSPALIIRPARGHSHLHVRVPLVAHPLNLIIGQVIWKVQDTVD
ncbi:MAG: hypothetical protein D6775_08135 [Caldilineae bacterium]|nr:MAG: hypothetical protein D6775_08135 [Caldilineae bacterium]